MPLDGMESKAPTPGENNQNVKLKRWGSWNLWIESLNNVSEMETRVEDQSL